MSEQIISTEGFHCVENAILYDLKESMIAAGYPMRTTSPDMTIIEIGEKDINRCAKLSKATTLSNQAHDQFMTGIRLSFDLRCSNKMWVEAERYHFLEFVSSQSTMHRITKFGAEGNYNIYVDDKIIAIMDEKIKEYNRLEIERDRLKAMKDPAAETIAQEMVHKYLEILYSNPAGFELTARMTTNYRCLKNIYKQRKDHRLPEWREFCRWIETLPYAKEFLLVDN